MKNKNGVDLKYYEILTGNKKLNAKVRGEMYETI